MHPDLWTEIAGYNGRYEINPYGQIRRIYASCIRYMQHCVNSHGEVVIRLSDSTGQRHEHKVSKLVAAAFKPQPRTGMVLFHVNQCKSDNYVGNLKWTSRRALGKATGAKSRRQSVVKLNADGSILDFYSSARAAGRANHMSYQTVLDYCNGQIKKKTTAPDGNIYRWDANEKERSNQ